MSQRSKTRRKTAAPAAPVATPIYGSAGRYTYVTEEGKVVDNTSLMSKAQSYRSSFRDTDAKTAGLFGDDQLGYANVGDSNNIGMYSFEMPVDSAELPQSRAEEIRFFKLARDRNPIISHALKLHSTIPLSKMTLEKSKSAVPEFADYVFDFYQRMMSNTSTFSLLIQAVAEHFTFGDCFLFFQEPQMELSYGPEARKVVGDKGPTGDGLSPMTEAANGPLVGQEERMTDGNFMSSKKSSLTANEISKLRKQTLLKLAKKNRSKFERFITAGIGISASDTVDAVDDEIMAHWEMLAAANKAKFKSAKVASITKTADPAPTPAPAPGAAPAAPAGGDAPPVDGAVPGEPGAEGIDGAPMDDLGGDMPLPSGGGGFGGGGGGGMVAPEDAPGAAHAVEVGEQAKRDLNISQLKRQLKLLEKKKELLEELETVMREDTDKRTVFGHETNKEYEGYEKIEILPIDMVDLDPSQPDEFTGGPSIMYRPSAVEKDAYLEDDEVPKEVKDMLDTNGHIPLNQNPYLGSYVVQFSHKRASYEANGRSILQPIIRDAIYAEKLRQVQTTLASRNMTPKTLLTAPGISLAELAQLRIHADEAKADPDYTICVNYDVTWNEIGSEGRLLSLEGEWQHINSNMAIGLGFSPEILIGEGLYGGNRIQLEIMTTIYTQLRETLSDMLENKVFKPISVKKGFYETDNYGRARWVYPKISFGRMALRDSGDLYDMMLNLYTKGSLPVSLIYEFLDVDPETIRRQLEDDLFTVNDSKFNEALGSAYQNIGERLLNETNMFKRVTKSMGLDEEATAPAAGMEGSGDGF